MNKETFFNLLFSCIKITTDKYPDNIYYYYDKKLIRKQKLKSLLNKSSQLDLKNINKNNILFEQNIKHKELWINYNNIWRKIETYNGTNYIQTKEMIENWLKDDTNWKQYSSGSFNRNYKIEFKDDTIWKQY